MREILFRGKRKDNGEWVDGCFAWIGDKPYIIPVDTHFEYGELMDCEEVILETVGQFTGLFDKNGIAIFEGDIIHCVTNGFDREVFITEIKFGARSGVQGFYLANDRSMFYFGQSDLTKFDDGKIIGNIHDNPELLEVSK